MGKVDKAKAKKFYNLVKLLDKSNPKVRDLIKVAKKRVR
jgi:hypothetical protein